MGDEYEPGRYTPPSGEDPSVVFLVIAVLALLGLALAFV